MSSFIRVLALLMTLNFSFTVSANSTKGTQETILQHFQRHAPADTLFYMDGLGNPEISGAAENFGANNLQIDLLVNQLESINSKQYTAEIDFLVSLLKSGLEDKSDGLYDLSSVYGLHESMASAVYLDGLIPVVQLAVNDSQSLIKLFSHAGKQSGVKHQVQTWGIHDVNLWRLQTKQDLGCDLWLALAISDNVASISIMPDKLSKARRLDVLGLLPEAYSVADSQSMAKIREAEGYLTYSTGFINLLEIARAVSDPQSSKAGEDLIALVGDELLSDITKACRRDWLDIAEAVPQLVFGVDSMGLQGDVLDVDAHLLLQITDVGVAQALEQLNGHLPSYTLTAQDALFSAALGFDMSALVPVMSQLRSKMLAADFSCDELQDLQKEVMAMDLSALFIAASAGQGFSGLGAAIYDIDLATIADGSVVIDAIVSITTQYPELLSSLVPFVPQLSGVEIPSDGSSVALNIAELPPGITPKLAVKGKHFVIFDGPISKRVAQEMQFEKTNKLGIYSSSINYEKLGNMVSQGIGIFAGESGFKAHECADLHVSMATLSNTKANITMQMAAQSKGIRFDVNSRVKLPANSPSGEPTNAVKPGNYLLQTLAQGCEWIDVGTESIHADGTGQYEIINETQECATFQAQYDWQQRGGRLVFSETLSQARESCNQAMDDQELLTSQCILLASRGSGFDCLFIGSNDTDVIYRYALIP